MDEDRSRHTTRVPELAPLVELGVECVLDGELVAGAGLPSDFYPLAGLVSARLRSVPVSFVAFDVLRLNGRSLVDYDRQSRREILDCLVRLAEGWLTAVNTFPGAELDAVLAGCEQLGMEGVVLKRLDSPYRPGRRSTTGERSSVQRGEQNTPSGGSRRWRPVRLLNRRSGRTAATQPRSAWRERAVVASCVRRL